MTINMIHEEETSPSSSQLTSDPASVHSPSGEASMIPADSSLPEDSAPMEESIHLEDSSPMEGIWLKSVLWSFE
ncbi:hypothetical protein P9112_012445 [Eukaryota sp. TZLM1-RC]